MKGYSISFTLGKASGNHGGNVRHNNRDYFASNVNSDKTDQNIQYMEQDIEEAYHQLFDDALEEYNQKQYRKDRIIKDYYAHISKSKREETFYEAVVQFGSVKDAPCGSQRGELAKELLDEYMKGWKKRNPNLYVFNAVLHLDEASPHLHIDFIPFYTHNRQNSLQKGVSMKSALDEQGFKAYGKMSNRLIAWEAAERKAMEQILNSHGLEREDKNAHYKHMSVDEYKLHEAMEPMRQALRALHTVSAEQTTKENVRKLLFRLDEADERIAQLEKEKVSPHKSFFYSDSDKQAYIQSRMDSHSIPYVENGTGFEAQECYLEQIRQWEKEYKAPKLSAREKLRQDIDILLMQSDDVLDLYKRLESADYTLRYGKYISVKPPEGERFLRLKSLGEEYSEQALDNRVKYNHRFEEDLAARIAKAKSDKAPTQMSLIAIQFYTIKFKSGVLPCRKRDRSKPFTWTNDSELDKLFRLNKKINEGASITSMKSEFEELEHSLNEKNKIVEEAEKKVKRLSLAQEAFDILYGGKKSEQLSLEQVCQYQDKHPNINANNYHQVADIVAAARQELAAAKQAVTDAENTLSELSETIKIAEQVQAGTYIQELVTNEFIHRNADKLPNGQFSL